MKIFTGDDEMTWDQVGEGSLAATYTRLFNDNVYVKEKKKLNERVNEINDSYGDVNMGEKLVPEELLQVGGKDKALPSVQLVDQINSHIKSHKSKTIFKDYDTNDINELQTLVKQAYSTSVKASGKDSPQSKNILLYWKSFLNTIDNQLKGSPEAQKGEFMDIESFYDGLIRKDLISEEK